MSTTPEKPKKDKNGFFCLFFIKPHVKQSIRDQIKQMILDKGFIIIHQQKIRNPSRGMVERHYMDHKGKSFYENLVNYTCSGQIDVLVCIGFNAIKNALEVRQVVRTQFSMMVDSDATFQNVLHCSDGDSEALFEIWNMFEWEFNNGVMFKERYSVAHFGSMKRFKPITFFFVGNTGAGKTTIANSLKDIVDNSKDVPQLVSTTTREPREGEVDGKDYHFTTHATFDSVMYGPSLFIETATYPGKKERDEQYGLTWKEYYAKSEGGTRMTSAVVNIEGMKLIKRGLRAVALNPVFIWVKADSDIITSRMKERGWSDEMIQKRTAKATEESEWYEENKGEFYDCVENGDRPLEDAIAYTQNLMKLSYYRNYPLGVENASSALIHGDDDDD